jgi:hypothetical protein
MPVRLYVLAVATVFLLAGLPQREAAAQVTEDDVAYVWIGGVTPRSATVVARLIQPADSVRLVVRAGDAETVSAAASASFDEGLLARMSVDGLDPDTEYAYTLEIDGERIDADTGALVRSDRGLQLTAGDGPVEVMVLQGRPIGEPVARYGPFVMNTEDEIRQAFADYQRDGFGGWPWPEDGPVHGPEAVRFARHADGHEEREVITPA